MKGQKEKKMQRLKKRRRKKKGRKTAMRDNKVGRSVRKEKQRDKARRRGGKRHREMEEGGREIKIAERREIRQRLFPQDVVTTTTKRQRGNITTPLVLFDTCKCV